MKIFDPWLETIKYLDKEEDQVEYLGYLLLIYLGKDVDVNKAKSREVKCALRSIKANIKEVYGYEHW